MEINLSKKDFSIIIAIFSIVIFHHFFGYFGHFGYDDIHYAKLSKQIADGTFSITDDHYGLRWGLLILTAIFYKIFGINDHSSALPALIATFLAIVVMVKIQDQRTQKEKWTALLLFILQAPLLFYSDKIMPDILIMLSVLITLFIIYLYYFSSLNEKPILAAFLVSSTIFFGFVTKETIVLIIPLIGFLFLLDLKDRKNLTFWFYTIIISILIFSLYHLYFYFTTGNALFRYHIIKLNSYFSPCSYDQLPVAHLIKRISYELTFNFIRNGLFLNFIFLLPLYFTKEGISKLFDKTQEGFFFKSFTILFLSSNFMTASPTSYSPLCIDIRHYLFLCPIASLAATPVICHFIFNTNVKHKFIVLILSASTAFIAYLNNYETRYMYYGLFILILVRILTSKFDSIYISRSLLIVFILLLFQPVINSILYARSINYHVQKEVVYNFFSKNNENTLVITDPVEKRFGTYYLQFNSSKVKFIEFKDVTKDTLNVSKDVYVLLNGMTSYLSGNPYYPDYTKTISEPYFKNIFNKDDVRLYKVDKSFLLDWYSKNPNSKE